jgi:hypothetical protein
MGNRKTVSQKPSSKPAAKKKADKGKSSEKITELSDEDLHEISGGNFTQIPRDRLKLR